MEPQNGSFPSPNWQAQDWVRAYQSVLHEFENQALFKRIEVAEAMVRTRRESLIASAGHNTEQKALEDALSHLRFLKRSRLGFGDSEEDLDN